MKGKTSGRASAQARKATRARANLGAEVLEGLKQALAHQRGEHVPGLVVHRSVDVKALCGGTG